MKKINILTVIFLLLLSLFSFLECTGLYEETREICFKFRLDIAVTIIASSLSLIFYMFGKKRKLLYLTSYGFFTIVQLLIIPEYVPMFETYAWYVTNKTVYVLLHAGAYLLILLMAISVFSYRTESIFSSFLKKIFFIPAVLVAISNIYMFYLIFTSSPFSVALYGKFGIIKCNFSSVIEIFATFFVALSLVKMKEDLLVNQPEKRGNDDMKNAETAIYEIDGNMGKILRVYENRCVISTIGAKAALFGSALDGDKEFYYVDITSVQFKNLGMTTGYLQFEYAGSHSTKKYVNENSFTFSATLGSAKHNTLRENMPTVYEYVRSRVRETKEAKDTPIVTSISAADELKKFKELLDSDVITQEEFDAKKKQLLGL